MKDKEGLVIECDGWVFFFGFERFFIYGCVIVVVVVIELGIVVVVLFGCIECCIVVLVLWCVLLVWVGCWVVIVVLI